MGGSLSSPENSRIIGFAALCVGVMCSSPLLAQFPQYEELPISLVIPSRIDTSVPLDQRAWLFKGNVEIRKTPGPEPYIELETDQRAHVRLATKFIRPTPLPNCAVTFRWKTNRAPKDVDVGVEITVPAGRGLLGNAITANGLVLHIVEKRVKAVPGKEWTSVEVPFELGENGLNSLNQTYTVSLTMRTPRIKVAIDDLRIVPTAKK